MLIHIMRVWLVSLLLTCLAASQTSGGRGLQSEDLRQLRYAEDPQISPDGKLVAYTLVTRNRAGRPDGQVWITDATGQNSRRIGTAAESGDTPRWSPDGRQLAYVRVLNGKSELALISADGLGAAQSLAPLQWTNGPLPSTAERIAWSPRSDQIAYVSSTEGPEAVAAQGDPMVFTRYLYKPDWNEGVAPFSDNRRTHLFVVDVSTKRIRQLTSGTYYEHSIDWSPQGDQLLFLSNHERRADMDFNYDIFMLDIGNGSVRRLTATRSVEYAPCWSPDGRRIAFQATRRPLTSSETTMEDTHIWVMNADGTGRQEVSGMLDNRQGAPGWSPDGAGLYLTVEERGTGHLYQINLAGSAPTATLLVGGDDRIGSWVSNGWSVSKQAGALAYSAATLNDPSEVFIVDPSNKSVRRITHLNDVLLSKRILAPVHRLEFEALDGLPVEAFVTEPLNLDAQKKYPVIVVIHGGPHGAQGPQFDFKAQAYAAHGYGTLMVNYRGSTSYGQKFADAIFGDQDGAEARDVLTGVDAALGEYKWMDPDRLGVEGVSYGGQLTDWIITQTNRFRASIPAAGISNLVSFNFLSYYHDYLPVEFGAYPEEANLMDNLWQRSAIRHVGKVHTPVMLLHGLNDNDVPTEEAEQYYIALQEVGVETVLVLYPREGHGLQETNHIIDDINRSFRWYDAHFSENRHTGRSEPQ